MPSTTFTTSGSWQAPSDYKPGSLVVQCWGGGAAGGAPGPVINRAGGGGGGGEWAQDTPDAIPLTTYNFTVGASVAGSTGAGANGNDTTWTGQTLNVVANGGTGGGLGVNGVGGAGGTGSTNASHTNGTSGTSGSGAAHSGGDGGAGANGGGAGGNGGTSTIGQVGSPGTAPGGGGGGGESGSNTISRAGGAGAAGQITITWDTVIPNTPEVPRRLRPIVPMRAVQRARQNADAPLGPQIFGPPFICDPPLYPKKPPVLSIRRLPRGQAPTGHPVPLPPPMEPNIGIRRNYKPPWPRKGVTFFPWPSENIPAAESYRVRYKPPYPRRGIVAPTGLPVPVQPPRPGSIGVSPHGRTRRLRTVRGTSIWPGTEAVKVQPPFSTWIYKRRWIRPLLPRKGVVAPQALPPPPIITFYNPSYERRTQKYQWFRRGNVASTGWPVPVQPPMTSQSLRRWYKPPWPRRGVTPPTNIPEPVPTTWRMRRSQRYQWFRHGNAQPNTGLPVPVQPVEIPHSVRRYSRPLIPRKQSPKFAAFFIPVQPPQRMQSVRRWVKPLWPRRGRVNVANFPGSQAVTGYQLLSLQTFSYTPGTPGMDLTTTGLTLMPLNRLGFSFFNRYGDVLLIVFNNTAFPVTLAPNVIRSVENQIVQLPDYVLAPGKMQGFGPFPEGDFTSPDLTHPDTSYYMTVDVSTTDSGVYAGAFRLVSAPPYGHVGPFDRYMVRLRRLISGHQDHTSTPGEIHPGDSTPGA